MSLSLPLRAFLQSFLYRILVIPHENPFLRKNASEVLQSSPLSTPLRTSGGGSIGKICGPLWGIIRLLEGTARIIAKCINNSLSSPYTIKDEWEGDYKDNQENYAHEDCLSRIAISIRCCISFLASSSIAEANLRSTIAFSVLLKS